MTIRIILAGFLVSTLSTPEEIAHRLVDALVAKDYEKAATDFDATMKGALPPEALKGTWEGILSQSGAFQKRDGTRKEALGAYTIVFVTCVFENFPLDVKVVVDATGKIGGLWFVPSKPAAMAGPPSYAKPDTFDESEISFGKDPWVLPGTLAAPKGEGPHPAVVLVHGSGPNDRDETVASNKPFRDIAHGLASRGIAVIRYDKRTRVHGSRILEKNLHITVKEEAVDDAVLAVALLKQTPRIDPERIYVLGHSLGGMLIPRIAAEKPGAKGYIVLAGATRPLEDLMIEQVRYIANLDGMISKEEQKDIDTVEEGLEKIRALDPEKPEGTRDDLCGALPEYWLDLRGYDPAEHARDMEDPLFVLQGERDYQVTMVDFRRWKEAVGEKKNVTLKSYPNLNHLFMAGEGKSKPAEYKVPMNVAEEVIRDITKWIQLGTSTN